MFKTIFVPTSGSDTDYGVFATALAVARPLAAHLDFYHSRPAVCEGALAPLSQQEETLSANAVKHFASQRSGSARPTKARRLDALRSH